MARTPEDGIGGQSGNSTEGVAPEVIQANGQDVISLPDTDFVKNADILRDGQDLVLEGPGGAVVVIEGYFNAEPAPLLQAPDGQALTPQLVESFVHHAGPAQYAQKGSLDDESPVGAIDEVSGDATVTRADGSTETITIGTPIYEGDVIETSGGGAVNIVFIDETSFAVSQNAKLAIDEYVFDPATETGSTDFSVLRGLFVFTSGLIGRDDPDDVNIDTPMGSIGIRGTVIAGNVDTGEITVMEGAIVMRTFDGKELTMAEQFDTGQFDPASGEIVYIGKTGADNFSNTFDTLKPVAPNLFSGINDNQQGDDNGQQANDGANAQDQNGDDAQDGEQSDQGAAGGEQSGENENTEAGEQTNAAPVTEGQEIAEDASGEEGQAPAEGQNTEGAGEQQAGSDNTQSAADGEAAAGDQPPASESTYADTTFGGQDSGFDTSAGATPQGGTSGAGSTTGSSGNTAGGTSGAGTGSSGATTTTQQSQSEPTQPPPAVITPPAPQASAAITTDSFNLDEDAVPANAVGTLATTSLVTPTFAETGNGTGATLFDIDAAGNVTVQAGASFDYETTTSYSYEVQATGASGNIITKTITIDIDDVNEFTTSAVSDTDGGADSISEDAAIGTSVGVTGFATDLDGTDTITYSLDNNAGGLFTINATTGEVTLNGALDFETNTSHDIDIRATSSDGTFSNSGTITIAVTDANDAPVLAITNPSLANINEDDAGAAPSAANETGNLFGGAITDADGDPDGIAITGVDNANGQWEYFDGATWQSISGVSETGALLLAAGDEVRFVPNPDWNGTATFDFKAWDGTTGSPYDTGVDTTVGTAFSANTDTADITVDPVNDAPVADLTDIVLGDGYTEGGTITLDQTFFDATDVETSDPTQIVFQVTNLPANGTLDLNGYGTLSVNDTFTLQDVINGDVAYNHDGTNNLTDSFDFDISDDGGTNYPTTGETFNMALNGSNDAASLDLDVDDSTTAGTDYITTFTEDGGGVAVVDTDISIIDGDDANMESATITLTNNLDGALEFLEHSSGDGTYSGITVSGSGTDTITLTGTATLATYQAVIQAIQYNNLSDSPDLTPRTVDVTVNDGDTNSNTATATINITDDPNDADTYASEAGDNTIVGDGGDDTLNVLNGDGNDIFDGQGGDDSYDASGATNDFVYDLDDGTNETVTDTVSTDADTVTNVENFYAGSGNDTFNIIGTGMDFNIDGGGGNDLIDFSATPGVTSITVDFDSGQTINLNGTGTVHTFSDIEYFIGTSGGDQFIISSAPTQDHDFDGQGGNDTYDATNYGGGAITYDLTAANNHIILGALRDTVNDIENFVGTAFDDDIFIALADGLNYNFDGNADGANGDTIDFSDGSGAVTVDLTSGAQAIGGGFGTYNLVNIENVTGSDFNDTLRGTNAVNTVEGGLGNDTLEGSGGADTMDGGAGTDTVDYSMFGFANNITTLTMDSSSTAIITSAGGNDQLINIENVIGTQGDDTIDGSFDAAANVIDGHDGDDTLTGGNNDTLIGGAGDDTLNYDGGATQSFTLDGGTGADDIMINNALNMVNNGQNMFIDGGTSGADIDTLYFTGGGSITINPDGTNDRIENVEEWNFVNALIDTIDIDFQNFMTAGNIGNLLTIDLQGTDFLDIDFSGAGGSWYLSDSGTTFLEYTNDAETVLIQSTIDTSNVTVTGATSIVVDLDLNTISGADGFKITDNNIEGFAHSIAAIGDYNNDGYDDIAFTKATNANDDGRAFFLHGGNSLTDTTVPGLPASHTGLLNNGSSANQDMKISAGGDFNGDGVADYIVSATFANDGNSTGGTGNAQIIDGSTGSIIAELGGLSLDPGGSLTAQAGKSITFIGDINGDGYDDIMIGAPGTDSAGNDAGSAFLLLGKDSSPSVIDVQALETANLIDPSETTGGSARDIEFLQNSAGKFVVTTVGNTIEIAQVTADGASISGGVPDITVGVVTGLGGYTGAGGDASPLNAIATVGIHIDRSKLFILTNDTNGNTEGQITVLDLSTPSAPTFIGLYNGADLLGATAFDVEPDLGMITVINGNSITTIETNTFTQVANTGGLGTSFTDIDVHHDVAFVTDSSGNVRAFDISGATISEIDNFAVAGAEFVHYDEDSGQIIVFGSNNITTFSFDGATFSQLGTIATGTSNVTDMNVDEGIIYLTDSAGDMLSMFRFDEATGDVAVIENVIDGTLLDGASSTVVNDGFAYTVTGAGVFSIVDSEGEGIAIHGIGAGDLLGMNISAAGDYNNDGFDDYLISMPGSNGVALVLGGDAARNLDLSDTSTFIEIQNVTATDNSIPLFSLGDMDGDGISDIAVMNNSGNGQVAIFYGDEAATPGGTRNAATPDVQINAAAGFEIVGASAVGDFNGDGLNDFAVAMRDTSGDGDMVSIYVLYGGYASATIDNSTAGVGLNDSANAFIMSYQIPDVGADNDPTDFDFQITGAGDVNGDGFADLVIGTPDLDKTDDEASDDRDGEAIVVFGRETNIDIVFDGDAGQDLDGSVDGTVISNAASQSLVGTDGADTLIDGDYNDVSMSGGAGDDILIVGNDQFANLNGGGGFDTLQLSDIAADWTLDFTNVGTERLQNIEAIDASSTGYAQTVVLGMNDLFDMMQGSPLQEAKLEGGTDDVFIIETPDFFGAGILRDNDFSTMQSGEAELEGFDAAIEAGDTNFEQFNFGGYQLLISDDMLDNGNVIIASNVTTGNGSLSAAEDEETLVGSHGIDNFNNTIWADTAMFGLAGDDVFDLSNADFNLVNGGIGLDTLNIQNDIDLRGFNAQEISQIETLAIQASNTLTLSKRNILDLLMSSDDMSSGSGTLTIDGTASEFLQIDDMGAGSASGVNQAAIATALGASANGTSGGYYLFDVSGTADLRIDMNLIDSGTAEIL